jgi:hypothetical protein
MKPARAAGVHCWSCLPGETTPARATPPTTTTTGLGPQLPHTCQKHQIGPNHKQQTRRPCSNPTTPDFSHHAPPASYQAHPSELHLRLSISPDSAPSPSPHLQRARCCDKTGPDVTPLSAPAPASPPSVQAAAPIPAPKTFFRRPWHHSPHSILGRSHLAAPPPARDPGLTSVGEQPVLISTSFPRGHKPPFPPQRNIPSVRPPIPHNRRHGRRARLQRPAPDRPLGSQGQPCSN